MYNITLIAIKAIEYFDSMPKPIHAPNPSHDIEDFLMAILAIKYKQIAHNMTCNESVVARKPVATVKGSTEVISKDIYAEVLSNNSEVRRNIKYKVISPLI